MIVHDGNEVHLIGDITAIDRVVHDQLWWLSTQLYPHLVVLGLCCTDHGCRDVARWTCFWPGQTRVKCTPHRDAWAKVALVMGFELQSKPLHVEVVDEDESRARFRNMELE